MLQRDDDDLQGKPDSHEKSSNNLKQISRTKSSEPKPIKDAIQQDENCIRLKENAQNKKLFHSNITRKPSPRIKKG